MKRQRTQPSMKKPCPDLTAMNDDALREFWKAHRPENLKKLGDRLLAESLPRFEPRSQEFYPGDLAALRQARGWSLNDLAARLTVNSCILAAWESGAVRPPASLGLLLQPES